MAADDVGVYVTGNFHNTVDFDPDPVDEYPLNASGMGSDAFLTRYATAGDHAWAVNWGNLGDDFGWDVDVADDGFIYVCGRGGGTIDYDPGPGDFTLTQGECFVSKFFNVGTFQWANAWGEDPDEKATGVGVDGEGNVYVCGNFVTSIDLAPTWSPCFEPSDPLTGSGPSDAFMVKYLAEDGCW